MLILGNQMGKWISVIHKETGESIRLRAFFDANGELSMVFDDRPGRFQVLRKKAKVRQAPKPETGRSLADRVKARASKTGGAL